jgi:hypothetical protein
MRKYHAQFLGEGAAVTPSPYPTFWEDSGLASPDYAVGLAERQSIILIVWRDYAVTYDWYAQMDRPCLLIPPLAKPKSKD